MKMSPKILFFVIGLIALCSVIEARHFLKKLHEKEIALSSHSGSKALKTLLRKRRDTNDSNSSEELTSAEAGAMMKFFVGIAWEADKLDMLSGFIEEVSDQETNLTLIGWQRIMGDDGHVKEINTVQLVIPPKPVTEIDVNAVDDDDDDDDDEEDDRILPHNKIKEMKEVFEPMAELGIPASITLEEYNKKGEPEVLMYLDKDELFAKAEGFAIYNKTSIASEQDVDNFIKNLKPTIFGKPAILKYNVDGNLIVDQSHITPQLLGGVSDYYEIPENILLEGPSVIAQISQEYPQHEIPKKLAVHYNKAYPRYAWRVLVNPENYHITRDVSITLSYDNFDLDENSNISYLVYGIKKSGANK